jgi:uncharacterized protein (DUF1499 family)
MIRKISMLMAASIIFSGFSGAKPANIGVTNGQLARCPNTPNCVSTQASDSMHSIKPIVYATTKEDAMKKLIKVINSMPRTKTVNLSDDYIHAEFTSAVFRFVDDVEFYIDDTSKTIQFRSASRLGKSDFGVNRKRMEEIKRRFAADKP